MRKGRGGREGGKGGRALQGGAGKAVGTTEKTGEERAGVSSYRPSCPEDCVRRLPREHKQVNRWKLGTLPACPTPPRPRPGPSSWECSPTPEPPFREMPLSAHLYLGCSEVSEGDRSGMERDVEDRVVAIDAVVASSKEGGVQGRRSGRPAGRR